jgi:hypothetical protein
MSKLHATVDVWWRFSSYPTPWKHITWVPCLFCHLAQTTVQLEHLVKVWVKARVQYIRDMPGVATCSFLIQLIVLCFYTLCRFSVSLRVCASFSFLVLPSVLLYAYFPIPFLLFLHRWTRLTLCVLSITETAPINSTGNREEEWFSTESLCFKLNLTFVVTWRSNRFISDQF